MPKLFQNAFECAAIGMSVVDETGRYLRVNRAFCEMLGYTEAELLKRRWQDITHPDDLPTDLGYVDKLREGKLPNYSLEKRYVTKDGRAVWAMLTVAPPLREPGHPLRFLAQMQDITARKATEATLQRALAEQERLNASLRHSNEIVARLREGLLTICAWTKRIRMGDKWVTVEDFLTQLGLKVSHGMSDEIAGRILADFDVDQCKLPTKKEQPGGLDRAQKRDNVPI